MPPWSQAFEHMVPSWWFCRVHLGGMAILEEVHHWSWPSRFQSFPPSPVHALCLQFRMYNLSFLLLPPGLASTSMDPNTLEP